MQYIRNVENRFTIALVMFYLLYIGYCLTSWCLLSILPECRSEFESSMEKVEKSGNSSETRD